MCSTKLCCYNDLFSVSFCSVCVSFVVDFFFFNFIYRFNTLFKVVTFFFDRITIAAAYISSFFFVIECRSANVLTHF